MTLLKTFIFEAAIAMPAALSADGIAVSKFIINTNSPQQTIEHFGASDAWSMKYVGLWDEEQQRQTADWLFSTENDTSGKPLGIGLSVWRFNLGAGSEEQGRDAQIQPSTRTECLLNPDGTYDWTKQAGQRRFLHLAKERGVPYILAFMNSAPVQFTKNGLATNTGRGGTINLKDDSYDGFALFMATAINGIEKNDGIHIDYICPVNEPDAHWNWQGPKQEGSPATNREIAKLVKEMDKQLTKLKSKSPTQIIINESSDYRCMLGLHETDWQRGNHISTFFSKDSTQTYLGKLKNVPKLIVGHSYWTNTPLDFMTEIRKAVRDSVKKYNLRFWQTETCIMGNDEEIGGGSNFDFSMKTALYVARIIHHDLVFANASSWSWWRAVGGDYKDGLLYAYSTDHMKSGTMIDSKLLWSLGNYSRFVRPGAVRYDINAYSADGTIISEGYNDQNGVMCSAYKNSNGKWVVVAINYSKSTKPFAFATDNSKSRQWKAYRTSDISAESLAPIGKTDGNTQLTPRSITTFVEE